MKSVKNLVLALLLVFAFTANVAAGDVPIPPGPEPHATATTSADTTQPSLNPNSERSGETVDTSDYMLLEALAALLY